MLGEKGKERELSGWVWDRDWGGIWGEEKGRGSDCRCFRPVMFHIHFKTVVLRQGPV